MIGPLSISPYGRFLKILVVAVVYYASARMGLFLALGNTNASPVWPPSGFAFAVLLILGNEMWPGVLLGALVANIVVFTSNKAADTTTIILMSTCIAIGNTLEALTGSYLLRRAKACDVMNKTRDFTIFTLSCLLMCLVSCTIGSLSLWIGGIIGAMNFKTVWFTWWMGDVAGVIVLTPILLSWWNTFRKGWRMEGTVKFILIFLTMAIYLDLAFNGWLNIIPTRIPIYLLFVFFILCVYSIPQWQSSLIVLLVTVFAIWNTLNGKGPFVSTTQNDSLLTLQIFLCVGAIMMMFLSTTINERKLSEEDLEKVNFELKDAQKLQEESIRVKEQFLANMSHEIRTPMNAIIGFSDLLYKSDLSKDQKQYIEAIKVSGENLIVIINDILDFSKIQSGKIHFEETPMRLSALSSGWLELLLSKARVKNIDLIIEIEKNVPDHLLGDPTRLNQILLNLLDNAIKFTDKGSVKLKIELINQEKEMATLRFEVSDSGIGIEENKLSSIFDGFTQASNETTRKYGGTGLGLSIVKQLTELQGGTIKVKSKINSGSTFTLHLPFKKDPDPGTENKNTFAQIELEPLEGINVLLVEDNELNQMLTEKILSEWKWNINVADNGKIAIEKVTQTNYDIILMDIQLPEMDGYQVTNYIRKELPEPKSKVPIIAVTAHAIFGESEKCYAAGMNDYISKPFNRKILYTKIVSMLKKNG